MALPFTMYTFSDASTDTASSVLIPVNVVTLSPVLALTANTVPAVAPPTYTTASFADGVAIAWHEYSLIGDVHITAELVTLNASIVHVSLPVLPTT